MGPVERATRAKLHKANLLDDEDGDVQAFLIVAKGLDAAEREDDYTGVASLVREYRQLSVAIFGPKQKVASRKLDAIKNRYEEQKG